MDKPKFLEYDGLKFTRDEKTGYYLNSTNRVRMHVYVWKKEVGEIPKGYEIHHINRDKADNRIENLRLMKASEHRKLHASIMTEEHKEKLRRNLAEKARPKASEWHGSEEGRDWHRKHYDEVKEKLHRKEKMICANCGREFEAEPHSRFCSNACKSAWRRESGLDDVERICAFCGEKFIVNKYKRQLYCSQKCSAQRFKPIEKKRLIENYDIIQGKES